MSDDTAPTDALQPPKSETEKLFETLSQGFDYYNAPDRLLQNLANSAEQGGSGEGIPITLFLHGGMIAGHITSGQKFYRAMGQTFRAGFPNIDHDEEDKIRDLLDQYASTTFDSIADGIDKDIADDDTAYEEHGIKTARWLLGRQLYLTNAFYTVPGATSISRDYVAVKLSHVVGWTFGVTTWG